MVVAASSVSPTNRNATHVRSPSVKARNASPPHPSTAANASTGSIRSASMRNQLTAPKSPSMSSIASPFTLGSSTSLGSSSSRYEIGSNTCSSGPGGDRNASSMADVPSAASTIDRNPEPRM